MESRRELRSPVGVTCDEGVGAAAVVPDQGEENLPGHKGAEEERLDHLEGGNVNEEIWEASPSEVWRSPSEGL